MIQLWVLLPVDYSDKIPISKCEYLGSVPYKDLEVVRLWKDMTSGEQLIEYRKHCQAFDTIKYNGKVYNIKAGLLEE